MLKFWFWVDFYSEYTKMADHILVIQGLKLISDYCIRIILLRIKVTYTWIFDGTLNL